jgi:deoxyribonuclease-4
MKFGAHTSTGGGVWKAIERGAGISCETIQIFVKNNMQWFGKPYLPEDLSHYANQMALHPDVFVFGHTGYLINLGAPPSDNREKSVKSLVQELRLACDLGLPFLVLHPGAHLGRGEEEGLNQIIAGLNEVFSATRGLPVRIALENTAGQGTCLGSRIEHLARIYDGVKRPERLGLCLDTAHFFEAGYDLRAPEGWELAIQEVEDLIGLDQILAFHLNDSKTPLGSRVDRHAGIGQGHLGREAFRRIVNDVRFMDLPGCLETPKSADLHEDVENLAILRSLVVKKSRK